jgi:outer membrane protein
MINTKRMKNKFLIAAALSVLFTGSVTKAQQDISELSLSLKEAQDYAIVNNKMVMTARADVQASKAAVWETIASALPQVNASGSFTDNLKLMTTLLPGDFFGKPGEKVPVTFGSQFNSSASVDASLLIFNAPLYIGIETTKLAQKLSQQNLVKSELDTKESVSSAYFLILITQKSIELLDNNLKNLNETLKSTKAMYSAGMAEATDVDQMASNVTMVQNERSSLERTNELNYNLLRFQLGVSPATKITLTQTLEMIENELDIEAVISQSFDHTQNVDYKLADGQEMMSALNLRSQKASVLPTLAGFYNYGTNGMGDEISNLQWFDNSMAGLQLSVPIFAGGQRTASINKAQIYLEKARTTKEMVTDQLLLQEKQLRYNLVNANLQYLSQKENVEVSKRVYASTENKFKQGIASSLELTQANTLYLQAENNYLSSLLNLLQTKVAFNKLLNNI